ncbi:MAG: hypothetical protein QOD63_56 [Actinomycetota bacterium]|nr:hypothetical protein [Actinomycetota bacterium]
MDLNTITMERPKARQAFLEYRKAVREGGSGEDEKIMRGYRELARGSQLISLPETIAAGGVDHQGLPRLAVMQADKPWCFVRRTTGGAVHFAPQSWPGGSARKGIYRFSDGTLAPDLVTDRTFWSWSLRAMVPPIPPALRPPFKLSNYAILWEATWEKVPRPPGDPALLRHIGGDLYAVLAIWDLTDLERAVLAGRSAT